MHNKILKTTGDQFLVTPHMRLKVLRVSVPPQGTVIETHDQTGC